jgi:hypothetical protein
MEVGGGAATCRAHRPNALSNRDPIAALNLDIAQMRVPSLKAVAMIDFNCVTIARTGARMDHDARRGGHNWRALKRRHIEPAVERWTAGEGVHPLTVA